MRTFAPSAVLAVLLATGTAAHADAPGIPGTRKVLASHRIVAREPFPDHVFVLCDGAWGETRWAEFVTVEPGRPLLIEFDSRAPRLQLGHAATLVIMPRADVPLGPAVDVANAALAGRIVTATRHTFYRREGGAPPWSDGQVTVSYEVRRAGDGEQLEVVRTTWNQGYQCCMAALFCPIAVFFGGFYLIRRLRKPARATENGCATGGPGIT